ncbi:DUF1344 domain-containing protein [Pararhizobium haloflavum]|uniref:DUF1344 domain-containing protein n=1 Tax=Pararhizobium haloflavum TaxID=2037914 RepID=UPI000C1A8549|nr:DUF1344 domain-containing protein [Pararhizobium haloflavum]
MRFVLTALLLTSSLIAPLAAFAEARNAGVEARIASIDPRGEHLALDDGNIYMLPGEFDLEGLSEGTLVYVYYVEEDGKRRVFDLEVIN